MDIETTGFEGILIINTTIIEDLRGYFCKIYNEDFFKDSELDINFKEFFYSVSSKDVIRGMHYQSHPFECDKLIHVSQGVIRSVILDIRKASPTFGKYFVKEIDKSQAIFIKKGFANGFLSLSDNTIVNYLQTSVFHPLYDNGIRWDSFGYDWSVKNPIISEKDRYLPPFDTEINQTYL